MARCSDPWFVGLNVSGFDDYRNFIREETANDAAFVVKTAKPWITKNKLVDTARN